jgi:hypothetical protein
MRIFTSSPALLAFSSKPFTISSSSGDKRKNIDELSFDCLQEQITEFKKVLLDKNIVNFIKHKNIKEIVLNQNDTHMLIQTEEPIINSFIKFDQANKTLEINSLLNKNQHCLVVSQKDFENWHRDLTHTDKNFKMEIDLGEIQDILNNP